MVAVIVRALALPYLGSAISWLCRILARSRTNAFSDSGGHWAPAIADYFVKQQRRVKLVKHDEGSANEALQQRHEHAIGISTVGIINGFVDFLVQGPSYPTFAVNNTLGIQAYPKAVADSAMANFTKPGGCRDLILACRQAAAKADPNNFASSPDVLAMCQAASLFCWAYVYSAYDALSGVSALGKEGFLLSVVLTGVVGSSIRSTWASPCHTRSRLHMRTATSTTNRCRRSWASRSTIRSRVTSLQIVSGQHFRAALDESDLQADPTWQRSLPMAILFEETSWWLLGRCSMLVSILP